MNHGDQCRNLTLTPFARRVLPLLDLDVQLDAERRRQRGWRLRWRESGQTFGGIPSGPGELVFGPPGSHVEPGADR